MVKLVASLIGIVLTIQLQAQEIKPVGQFMADSLKIGEPIDYALSVRYPTSQQVLFPDSSFNYQPFEFLAKQYFPTRIEGEIAIDSAIYTLTSFEIDKVQQLGLPIFVATSKDSIAIRATADSVFLQELIPVVSDSLELKANTEYFEVPFAINYPYITIGIIVFIVILVVVYFVFGKTIRKNLKLRKLRKEYEKFSQQFESSINQVRTKVDPKLSEQCVGIWKAYMERLEEKPYTKLTTRELVNTGISQDILGTLKDIDRNIYGSKDIKDIHRNFEQLEDYTLERYQEKVREVKNG